MKKLVPILLMTFLLTGCFNSPQKQLTSSMNDLIKNPYYEVTHKGSLSINFPKELIANQQEEQLLSSLKEIPYYIQTTSTAAIKDSSIQLNANNQNLKLQIIQNEKESLISNGKGWFLFKENNFGQYINSTTFQNLMLGIVSITPKQSITKGKELTIEVDKQLIETSLYQVRLTQNQLKNVQLDIPNSRLDQVQLSLYIDKENRIRVIQYQIDFHAKTAFHEKEIGFQLNGNSIFDRVGDTSLQIKKPTIGKRYNNSNDFLLDLILKETPSN